MCSLPIPGCEEFCRPSNTGKPRLNPRRFISRAGKAGFCCGDSESSVADNGSSGRLTALSKFVPVVRKNQRLFPPRVTAT